MRSAYDGYVRINTCVNIVVSFSTRTNKAAIKSLGLLLLIAGCGGGSNSGGGGNIEGNNEVGKYIQSLPTWRAFSPRVTEFDGPSGDQ